MHRYSFQVEVHPQYLPEQSDPDASLYVFAYTITITNTGTIPAQLISRTWNVNDADGLHEKIRGLGVVGHQPLLKPGEEFEYTSWTRIDTPQGQMEGTFFCMTEDAHPFDAPVPAFALVYPGALH